MTRARRVATLAAGAWLACLAALGGPRSAHAGAFDVSDTTWEGTSELLEVARAELGEARVVPVAVLRWDEVEAEDGVLVLHPQQELDPDETVDFMKAGGRLAILDDFGRGDATLRRFQIERVPRPDQPVLALRGKPALAIAEPVLDAGGLAVGPHPVVASVQRLVTNHPSVFRHPNLSPVLRIRSVGEPDAVLAVAGQVELGRLFAMGDPSAVTNQMLRYPGNRAFVAGLARYLVDDDGARKRGGRLFVVANRFDQEGSFGGEKTPAEAIRERLRRLRAALADARREGLPPWVWITVAVLVALGLAGWVRRSAARPYKNPLPRYARQVALVGQGGVAGRFALLAAPSSPRSLALMELKAALFEALAERHGLEAEPSPDALRRLVEAGGRAGGLDPKTASAFEEVLATMQRVEASLVAGRATKISRAALEAAAEVVAEVLAACAPDAVRGSALAREGRAAEPAARLPHAPNGTPVRPAEGESAA